MQFEGAFATGTYDAANSNVDSSEGSAIATISGTQNDWAENYTKGSSTQAGTFSWTITDVGTAVSAIVNLSISF